LINFSAVCLSIIPHFDGEVKQANTRYCFYFLGYQQYFVLYSFCSICLRPGKVCFCQARVPSFNSNFSVFTLVILLFRSFLIKIIRWRKIYRSGVYYTLVCKLKTVL